MMEQIIGIMVHKCNIYSPVCISCSTWLQPSVRKLTSRRCSSANIYRDLNSIMFSGIVLEKRAELAVKKGD
jgi:hypothetical protein